MEKKIKILVCTHKKSYIPDDKYLLPIHVGKENSTENIDAIGDNTGDNISHKNKNYCELTAIYWAWKNLEDYDIIGLNHYRRYFDFDNCFWGAKDKTIIKDIAFSKKKYHLGNIEKLLDNYDIIVPKRIALPYSISTDYKVQHIIEDLRILKDVVLGLTPEYERAFNDIMQKNNKISPYNMFMTKKSIFDDYSDWLFKILFEVEQKVSISSYPSQARIFGYMGERLLNVYCKKHQLRIKYLPVIYINNQNDTNKITYHLNNIRFNLSFWLTKYSRTTDV